MQHIGFAKQAGVKRLGRILRSAVKSETSELVEAAGRAASKVTRRARKADVFEGKAVAVRAEQLTGRLPVFHGTGQRLRQKILREGVLPPSKTNIWSHSKHVSSVIPGVSERAIKRNSQMVFAAGNREAARRFAVGLPVAGLKGRKPRVISLHVKTWGDDGVQKRLNPFVSELYRKSRKLTGGVGVKVTQKDRRDMKGVFDEVAFDRVPPRFVVGSKRFKPMTGREVVDYAKEHPRRVRGALARVPDRRGRKVIDNERAHRIPPGGFGV